MFGALLFHVADSVFGRSAVAAPSLPFNCAVEVEAIFEIGPPSSL